MHMHVHECRIILTIFRCTGRLWWRSWAWQQCSRRSHPGRSTSPIATWNQGVHRRCRVSPKCARPVRVHLQVHVCDHLSALLGAHGHVSFTCAYPCASIICGCVYRCMCISSCTCTRTHVYVREEYKLRINHGSLHP
jgi:hypothetical protein